VGEWLSFHLREEFLDRYRNRIPDFGYPMGAGNTLGHHAWITKYARVKPDGTREHFWEGLARVISGMYSIQKDHAQRMRLPWDEEMAHRSAQEAYDRAFCGKWSPPGRGLWAMGTEMVNGKGDSSALQNCAMISTGAIHESDDPSQPFSVLMSMLMLGIGVGFDTRGAGKLAIQQPEGRYPHLIPDSREGWCESVGALLRAFLVPGRRLPVFDYSKIRPAGEPIRGFGGVASGPGILRQLHEQLTAILSAKAGELLSSTDITDIMNLEGKCVIAGNVRRSAEIALGMADDEAFLELKNWERNPVRMGPGGWGHLSNNSVIAESGGDYSHLAPRIALNGEPGIIWLDVMRDRGRLADPADGKDYRVAGINPCLAGDTWIMTTNGPRQIRTLKKPFWALVDGKAYAATAAWSSGIKETFTLKTAEGYEITLTEDHKIRRADSWVPAAELMPGDKIFINNQRDAPAWEGRGSWEEGYLCGAFRGDGGLEDSKPVVKIWDKDEGSAAMGNTIAEAMASIPDTVRSDWAGWRDHGRGYLIMSLSRPMLERFGLLDKAKPLTPLLEETSADFHRGFLRGMFDTDGHIEAWEPSTRGKGTTVRLSQSDYPALVTVQRMLLRVGIKSRIYKARPGGERLLPDGRGGEKLYYCKQEWRLVVSADDVPVFAQQIGFSHQKKQEKLEKAIAGRVRGFYAKLFCATVSSLESAGTQEVFDLTVDTVHAMDGNGMYIANCGEQPLEDRELCTLVESFPARCDGLQDYLRTLKFAYLYAKTVTLLPTCWPQTNEVMTRNRRIGTSMTGVVQFAEEHGWAELRRWQDAGYQEIRKWDHVYSEWLGVRESIRVTTIKPSGTVSLLWGATPGVHWPRERGFYIRTVRDMTGSPFARAMEEAGYHVEPSVMDPDTTVVITLPVEGPDIRSEREVSIWEKASLAAQCQRWWSDNAVSCTVTFSEEEAKEIPAVLRAFDGQVKSMSFLPMGENVYDQAPYQRCSRELWEFLRERVRPVDWEALYGSPDLPEAEGESYCTSDTCEVPRLWLSAARTSSPRASSGRPRVPVTRSACTGCGTSLMMSAWSARAGRSWGSSCPSRSISPRDPP
jgi:ribonucleotide reductase alpha subunit